MYCLILFYLVILLLLEGLETMIDKESRKPVLVSYTTSNAVLMIKKISKQLQVMLDQTE